MHLRTVLLYVLVFLLASSDFGESRKSTGIGSRLFGSRTKPKSQKPTYGYAGTGGYRKPPSGGGMGRILKSPTTKGILAGLAAGYVSYKVSQGISRMMYNGIDYYPGRQYYPGLSSPSRIRCEYQLKGDEVDTLNLTLGNGTKATTLIFECDSRSQYCCEMHCCPLEAVDSAGMHGNPSWLGAVFGLIVTVLMITCVAMIVYKFSRRLLDCVCPTMQRQGSNGNFQPVDPNEPYTQGPGYPPRSPQPGYPPQPGFAPQPGYPPQPGFAPQPGYQPQSGYPQAPYGYPPVQTNDYTPQQPGYPAYPPDQPPPYGFGAYPGRDGGPKAGA